MDTDKNEAACGDNCVPQHRYDKLRGVKESLANIVRERDEELAALRAEVERITAERDRLDELAGSQSHGLRIVGALQSRMERAEAEVERITAERDEWQAAHARTARYHNDLGRSVSRLSDEVERVTAEREAIWDEWTKEFRDLVYSISGGRISQIGGSQVYTPQINVKTVERALAVLVRLATSEQEWPNGPWPDEQKASDNA